MIEIPFLHHTLSIVWLVGGLGLGLVAEYSFLGWLRRWAKRTTWEGDEIIIDGLRSSIVYLLTLAGAFGTVLNELTGTPLEVAKKIIYVLVILVLVRVAIKISVGFVNLSTQKMGVLPSTSIFPNITRLAIYVMGLLFILQSLGIAITPLITALGIGGLAVALALQDTLANLFAGLQVLAAKKIKPGDYIQLESGEAGYVEDVTWRYTTIRMLQGNLIIVPNSNISSTIVTNFDLPNNDLAVLINVGVSYASDLQQVEDVTKQVATEVMQTVDGGVPDFEPFIRYNEFSDSSIKFTVILRAKTFVDQYLIKHEFIKRLHEKYGQTGIEIPFPIRTVHLKKP